MILTSILKSCSNRWSCDTIIPGSIELIENENSNLKSQEEQTTLCSAQLILVENSNTDQNDVKDISAEQNDVDVIDPEFSVDPEKNNYSDECKDSNCSHKLKTLEYKLDKNNKDSNLDGLANLSIGDNIENKEDNNEKNINNKKESEFTLNTLEFSSILLLQEFYDKLFEEQNQIEDYIETLIDIKEINGPKLYVFIKYIIGKAVYIKIKIRSIQNRKIFCISFHFARYENFNYPYKGVSKNGW